MLPREQTDPCRRVQNFLARVKEATREEGGGQLDVIGSDELDFK